MSTPPGSAIVDNRRRTVGNFIERGAEPGSVMSVVSAYFTIYGYDALRAQLEDIDGMRFLYGDPRGLRAVDPTEAEDTAPMESR